MKTQLKIQNSKIRAILALVAISSLHPLRAEVTLFGALGSNMVIQRDRPATLWGWADAGEKVTVKLGSQVVTYAEGQGGKTMWRVKLPLQKAGPIADIIISGSSNSVTLTNFLAGDVWLCSGQSNTKALYELDFSSERQRLLDCASNRGSLSGPCPGWSSLWPQQ